MVKGAAATLKITKTLFGWNGSVPFGDCFHSKKRVLSVLKRKETEHLYGGTERNCSNRTGPTGSHHWATDYAVKNALSLLKRKEKEDLYEGTERNRCIQTGPKHSALVPKLFPTQVENPPCLCNPNRCARARDTGDKER